MKKICLLSLGLLVSAYAYGRKNSDPYMYFTNKSHYDVEVKLDYPDHVGCPDFTLDLPTKSDVKHSAPPKDYSKDCRVTQILFTQKTETALPNKYVTIKGHHGGRHFVIHDDKITHNIGTKEPFYFSDKP